MKQSRTTACVGAAALLLLLAPAALAAIQLTPVVSTGISSPVFVGHAGDDSNRLFIVERGGLIRVLQPGSSAPTTFFNVNAITTKTVGSGEQGLLGLAFHPQYSANGRFFVFYTRAGDGALVIAEYHVSADDPDVADQTEIPLLTIPHPTHTNHNGGMLAFGPDGYLYIGVGDGGSGNDPPNNAQNVNTLLGKILRIDVDPPEGSPGPYVSPSTNPYFGGTPGLDEIFAIGLRNPWRFSFDRGTGQQWVADVGQGAREEVNSSIVNGGNYGWRVYEGFACTGLDPGLCNPANYRFPAFDYAHTGGRCSVTGGYVYRGSQGTLPLGTYVYGDFCTGEIFAWDGVAQSLLLDTGLNISSFGEDEAGEIYVVGLGGTVSKIVSLAAVMTSPTPGSTLTGASVNFTWTAAPGADEYWIHVGNTVGANDLYSQSQGLNLSGTVTGLPTDGRTLHVRLSTRQDSTWLFNDYVYTAAPSSGGGGAPGRVGYWRFDESSGSMAADSSGTGNAGTLINAPTWSTGKIGGAIQLNGTSQDLRVADSPSLSITGTGLTLATWIYPAAAQHGTLLHKDAHYSLFRDANGSIKYADSATWSYAAIGAHGMTPVNAWSHVAVTFDGGAIRFYVNGQLVGTVPRSGALTDNASSLYIGSYVGRYRFAGKLDEAQVYNRALTGPEVADLFAAGSGAPGNQAPVITSVTATPATIPDSETSQLSVVASDPDSGPGPLTYSWSVPAGTGSLSNANVATPVFTPAPVTTPRVVTVNVTVSDGAASVIGSVDVSVSPSSGGGGVSGRVGYWRFDEGSGGVAGDSSGNGNVGTLVNAPAWSSGKIGGAIQLNGSSQDVRVADSPSLSVTGGGLTLATWIYPTAAQNGALLHKDSHYSLFRFANGSISYADSATWSYATIGAYGLTPLNTWSHVAVTFDGAAIRFYVNGQLIASRTRNGSLTDNANPLYIGSYAGTSRFAGKLDEAQVYNRALSAAEVANLYAGGTSALVGHWTFDEGNGSVAGDSSGNGNAGTLINSPTWTTGKIGGAIQLNGTNQDVRVADSPSLGVTGGGLTLATWIYPTVAQNGALLHKDAHYSLFRNANGSITYADSVTWSYAAIGAHGHTPLNAWSHVTVTFDGGTIRFYVDGQLVGSVPRSGALTDNANPLHIGSYVGTSRFAGKLDDARVYSRALSAQEVADLYAAGAGPP